MNHKDTFQIKTYPLLHPVMASEMADQVGHDEKRPGISLTVIPDKRPHCHFFR